MTDLRFIPDSVLVQIIQLLYKDTRYKKFVFNRKGQYYLELHTNSGAQIVEIDRYGDVSFWDASPLKRRGCCNQRKIQKLLDPYIEEEEQQDE